MHLSIHYRESGGERERRDREILTGNVKSLVHRTDNFSLTEHVSTVPDAEHMQ
jgi:hypothetical protein